MTPAASESWVAPELARLLAGHVCLHASMAGLRMAAPLLALNQGYDKVSVGVLVALFALTQIFLSLPAGRLADRCGLKLPIAISVVGATAGTALAAIWPVFPVLCVAALLSGGSIGSATIALQRHAGRMATSPRQLTKTFSWLSLAPAISNFLGPFTAGIVIDHFGFRAAFVLLSVLALTSWLWIRTVREIASDPAHARKSGSAWGLCRQPSFRRLMVMNWFFSASWDVHGFMVPVLGHERGLSASVIGSILGTFALSAAIVRLAIPAVSAKLREWVLITGATALTGVVFGLYPFAMSALAMAFCSAVAGMALGAVHPMIMSMLHQITPPHRHGQALALRVLLINVSSVSMPILFGAAGGLVGASGVFWAIGLIVGLGSHLGFGLRNFEKAGERGDFP